MFRISVLYPRTGGSFFDLNYYINSHMKLVQDKLKSFGLQGVEVDGGIDDKNSPYFAIGYLIFKSLEEYQAGFSAAGALFLKDIPNYTDCAPIVQVSQFHRLSP